MHSEKRSALLTQLFIEPTARPLTGFIVMLVSKVSELVCGILERVAA
ncbi:MAG: hypothetical protein IJS90_09005 [Clostridia bacterium]|nr:hypothetical protein [Clostridia bacterium]